MASSTRRPSWCAAVLILSTLLTACSAPKHSAPRQYAQSLDSASNSCRNNAALCTPTVSERMPVVPPVRPPPTSPRPPPTPRAPQPLSGAQRAAINVASVAAVVRVVIDATLEARIHKALAECADEARSHFILEHFGEKGPTREQCNEVVSFDSNGVPVTRAMLLGREQHERALQCVEQRLAELKPGGFSLSPRYRYDPSTGSTEFIPREQVAALLNQRRSTELIGTMEPDIVIHLPGRPLHVQAVFDFKFPCANGAMPRWREYDTGPHAGRDQKELYEEALKVVPWRVIPRRGVIR
jgi:hypothetical protein